VSSLAAVADVRRPLSYDARVRHLVTVVAFALAFIAIACSDTDNMREDVLLCEEAASHYESCCGHPMANLKCWYEFSCLLDCSHTGDTSVPDLDTGKSRCLMNLGCGDMKGYGVCEQTKSSLDLSKACR
jgi:hypothetical protein